MDLAQGLPFHCCYCLPREGSLGLGSMVRNSLETPGKEQLNETVVALVQNPRKVLVMRMHEICSDHF